MTTATLRKYSVAAWILLLCIASQIPYYEIWTREAGFPYDASTIFSYWNIARLSALRDGIGFLGFFHTGIATEIWPSYFFSGLLRQLAALVQANTASAHAIIQAIHIALLVPAVTLLLRTFGIRPAFGAVGGLLYALAGIHYSVSQHVYAHEAILYLVLSLWSLRELARRSITDSPRGRTLRTLFCGLMLVSLVRVHHEAALYVVPLLAWTTYHVWSVYEHSGKMECLRVIRRIALIALFVAICSIPMLATTYDLYFTNKTQPYTYATLSTYFPDPRIFGLSLLLPEFAGSLGTQPPYSFGTDPTLAYIFIGSFTVALYALSVASCVQEKKLSKALLLTVLPVVLMAYTYGPGNPVHRGITTIFPFLIGISHNFYGLHLLYLLAAFGVAQGLQILASGRGKVVFLLFQTVVIAGILYFSLRSVAQGGWGLTGSINSFASSLQSDTRWLVGSSILIAAVLAAATLAKKLINRSPRLLVLPAAIILVGFGGLIAVDILRPIWGSRFSPGSMNDVPASEVAEYFRKSIAPDQRPLRVFTFGGWRSNALLPLNVQLVNQPADTGGNRYITAHDSETPSESLLALYIREYGVQAFWAERGSTAWREILDGSPLVQHVFRSEWGGDVYAVLDHDGAMPLARGSDTATWNEDNVTIEQGLVTRRWTIDIVPAAKGGSISLPLLWRPLYGVKVAGGSKLDYTADPHGRVSISPRNPISSVIVEYPNKTVSVLVLLSALVYLIWSICMLFFVILAGWEYRRNRRVTALPSS